MKLIWVLIYLYYVTDILKHELHEFFFKWIVSSGSQNSNGIVSTSQVLIKWRNVGLHHTPYQFKQISVARQVLQAYISGNFVSNNLLNSLIMRFLKNISLISVWFTTVKSETAEHSDIIALFSSIRQWERNSSLGEHSKNMHYLCIK